MHTFTHRWRGQLCRATASSSGAVRVRCLAQGHLNTRTSNLLVSRQLALPPELNRPYKNKVDSLSRRARVWIKGGAGKHGSKWSSPVAKVKQCHLPSHPLFIFLTKREETSWQWTLFIWISLKRTRCCLPPLRLKPARAISDTLSGAPVSPRYVLPDSLNGKAGVLKTNRNEGTFDWRNERLLRFV